MKKTIAVIVCVAVLASISAFATVVTQGNPVIAGLQENLNELWMKNYFVQDEMDSMVAEWEARFTEEFWASPWALRQSIEWRLITYDNPEDELAFRIEQHRPDLMNAVRITPTYTTKYIRKYVNYDVLEYLFDSEEYWSAYSTPTSSKWTSGGCAFSLTGEVLNRYMITLTTDVIEFLQDTGQIQQLLLSQGETMVYDIRIIGLIRPYLYIKGANSDYLIKLFTCSEGKAYKFDDVFPQIEPLKIYTVDEAMETILTIPNEYHSNDTVAANIAMSKPTFSAEAEALQSAGLLQGNEKGLDLLKPLTRIEAATMLLRAIGESETAPDDATQTFDDVPPSHWGFGAAAKAQSLGIVNGMGDGTFAPDELVTDAQFSTMVLRAADTGEFDWQQAVDILIERGIITTEDAKAMDLFTRGDMAKIIYEAREKGLL